MQTLYYIIDLLIHSIFVFLLDFELDMFFMRLQVQIVQKCTFVQG